MIGQRISYVMQTIGPFYVLLGVVALAIVAVILLIMRDVRPAFVPFLIAIYAINVESTAAYLALWTVRWLFLVVLFFRSLRYFRHIGPFSKGQWIFLILTFWSLLMCFQAPNPSRGLAISAIMFLTFFGVLFTIISEVRDEYSFLRFVSVFVWVGLVITIGAAIMFAAAGFRVASTMGARLSGIFANPGVFAGGLAVAVPVLVWRMLNVRRWVKKAFYFILFIIGSCLTFLTGSRGAIGVAVVGVTVLFARHNVRLILPLVLLLFIGVHALLPFAQEMRGASQFMAHLKGETGLTGRAELWGTASGLISRRPLTGWGTGISTDLRDPTCPVSSFHNAYLDSAVDVGLLGPILWTLLFSIYAVRAFRLCFSGYISGPMRSVCWLLLGNVLALSLLGIFAGSPVSVTHIAFYWLMMNIALVMAGERIAEANRLEEYEELYEDEELLGEEPITEYGEPAYNY